MKRAYPVLAGSLLAFVSLQALVFHSGLYAYWVHPDSSSGYLETVLYHEQIRRKTAPAQILGIGDSRMPLVRKHADSLTENTSVQFGTIAVAGTSPRCWYYMLRDADPEANRYKIILFGVDNYNDDELLEDPSNREVDLYYLLARLRATDLREFSRSFHEPQLQQRAAAVIAFRGLGYKRDFEDFLHAPIARMKMAHRSWRDSYGWFYDFHDDEPNLTGLTVDWKHRTLVPPPALSAELVDGMRHRFFDPIPPVTGLQAEYLTRWYGQIADRYRGSTTKLVFFRLPRAPWVRPDLPPTKADSSLRVLARHNPNVILLPENLMDELEHPEFFKDYLHLAQNGLDRATEILAAQVREILGSGH